jgi:osmoprotectant transport system permease protein
LNFIEATVQWLTDPANWQGPGGIPARLAEHVELSLAALLIAAAIALPVGLAIGHARRGSGVSVGLATIGRSIPSFALMGLFLPITQAFDPDAGFRIYPTLLAMAILAVPPILVNTLTGVREVDQELVEAARGMGFTEGQVLRRVEVPLALPVIVGGIRSATVQVIATTTLGAILAFGGLGRYIVDGIATNDDGQLYGGVVLVAGLALLGEGSLAVVQRLATRRGRGTVRVRPLLTPGEAPRAPASWPDRGGDSRDPRQITGPGAVE